MKYLVFTYGEVSNKYLKTILSKNLSVTSTISKTLNGQMFNYLKARGFALESNSNNAGP